VTGRLGQPPEETHLGNQFEIVTTVTVVRMSVIVHYSRLYLLYTNYSTSYKQVILLFCCCWHLALLM